MLSSEDPGLIVIKVFLSEGETPYLVHCLEGKDRTRFAIMVLEALMGWNATQITDDYMQTYANYYGIEPGTEKYDLIEEKTSGRCWPSWRVRRLTRLRRKSI